MKFTAKMKKACSAIVVVVGVLASSSLFGAVSVSAATPNHAPQTATQYTGYLIDEHCFAYDSQHYLDEGFSNINDALAAEAADCGLMDSCEQSGYGVAVGSGNSFTFYYLSGNIATSSSDPTGYQLTAYNLFSGVSGTASDLLVNVSGSVYGTEQSPYDGIYYAVLHPTSLQKSGW